MKNIPHSSRETDYKVLMALSSLFFSVFAGYALPTPLPGPGIRFLDVSITIIIGVFVWGVFNLYEPSRRYSRKWAMAKAAGIPIIWLLLVIALAVWFSHLHGEWDYKREQLIRQTVQPIL